MWDLRKVWFVAEVVRVKIGREEIWEDDLRTNYLLYILLRAFGALLTHFSY